MTHDSEIVESLRKRERDVDWRDRETAVLMRKPEGVEYYWMMISWGSENMVVADV